MQKDRLKVAIRTSLIYAVFGCLWILLSDWLLSLIVNDTIRMTRLQNYKGWLFVAASTLLIFSLLRHYIVLQNRADEEVYIANERYRMLMETSLDAILITDPNGGILSANPAACRILGRTEKDLRRVGRAAIVDATDSRLEKALQQCDQTGFFMGELTFVRADGSTFTGEVSSAVFTDRNGQRRNGLVIRDISERKRSEVKLRQMTASLAEAQEAERQALSKELHDQVGQDLTTLSINLNLIRSKIGREPLEALAARFDPLLELVSDITEKIRDVMGELHPPVLTDYGLAAALRWYGERLKNQTSLEVVVSGDLVLPRLSLATSMTLFRIAKEALINVVKHAGVAKAEINIQSLPDQIQLEVLDQGRGFAQPMDATDEHSHWGLLLMRERAELLNGTLEIESAPGQGTIIRATLPR